MNDRPISDLVEDPLLSSYVVPSSCIKPWHGARACAAPLFLFGPITLESLVLTIIIVVSFQYRMSSSGISAVPKTY